MCGSNKFISKRCSSLTYDDKPASNLSFWGICWDVTRERHASHERRQRAARFVRNSKCRAFAQAKQRTSAPPLEKLNWIAILKTIGFVGSPRLPLFDVCYLSFNIYVVLFVTNRKTTTLDTRVFFSREAKCFREAAGQRFTIERVWMGLTDNWQIANFNWQLTFALGFTDNWQRTWLSCIIYETHFWGLLIAFVPLFLSECDQMCVYMGNLSSKTLKCHISKQNG